MKKSIKKTISIITAVLLLFSINATFVNAADNCSITQAEIEQALNSDICNMWNAVLDTPEALGFTNEDVKDAYIGEAFYIVRYNADEVEAVNDIVYLPIISNNKILALITLIKYDGIISCSIGKDFANELSNCLSNKSSQVALFQRIAVFIVLLLLPKL